MAAQSSSIVPHPMFMLQLKFTNVCRNRHVEEFLSSDGPTDTMSFKMQMDLNIQSDKYSSDVLDQMK